MNKHMNNTDSLTPPVSHDDLLLLADIVDRLYHTPVARRPLTISRIPPLAFPSFAQHSFDEVKAILGRNWRGRFQQLFDLCVYLHSSPSVSAAFIMAMAQNSAFWMDYFHVSTQPAMHKIITSAIAIDLFALRSIGSRWEQASNTYWVNFDMVENILQWGKAEGLVHQESKAMPKKLSLEDQLAIIETASIRQSYVEKMRKVGEVVPFKGDRRLPPFTDAEVVYGLYESRPQYRKLLLTLQEINTFIPEDEWHRCSPNVSRDKHGNITKIGVRATNSWCSTKTEDDGNPNYHGTLREDLLRKRLGTWVEFDIKASIPSMSLLMTTGMWRDDSEDLYEKMSGLKFKDKVERQKFKNLFLPVYFNATPKQAIAHFKRRSTLANVFFSQDEWMAALNGVTDVLCNIINTVGKLGTEVFLHESCICANAMLRMLKEEGWRVLQIYDGFYIKTDGTDFDAQVKQERAAEIVKEEAEGYFRKWFGKEGK